MSSADTSALRAELSNALSTLGFLKSHRASVDVIEAQEASVQKIKDAIDGAGALEARVTLRELAEEIRMDRSACRRYVLRLGYAPRHERTSESGFQKALTFSRSEADAIKAFRKSEGY